MYSELSPQSPCLHNMVVNRIRLQTLPTLSFLAGSGLAFTLCLSLLLSSPIHIHGTSALPSLDTVSQTIPDGYTHNGKADLSAILDLRMALPWSDRDGLEKKLYDVSDPQSPHYGKYLTADQVRKYVQPSKETIGNVTQWLQTNGVKYEQMNAGEWLKVSPSVLQAERMLNAQFNQYTNDATGEKLIRSPSHDIPDDLKGHIRAIYPVTGFPSPLHGKPNINRRKANMKVSRSEDSIAVNPSCISELTPSCIQSLYNLPTTPTLQSRITAAIEDVAQVPSLDDLELFIRTFRPDVTETPTFQIITVDGGATVPDGNNEEVTFDMQAMLGIAPGVSALYISGSPINNGVNLLQSIVDTNSLLLQLDPMPSVVSISGIINEAGLSDSDKALLQSVCDTFMQVGVRGTTVLVPTGDGGVGGGQAGGACTTFISTFPPSCPFITAVGGTELNPDLSEVAASFTTGGFSTVFAMPDYQVNSAAISGYLQRLGNTNQGLFNRSGRAFPDLAVIGSNLPLIFNGNMLINGGTSASSPLFAGIVSLINDKLVSAGKSTLGFLNPRLYSGALNGGFKDITVGDNPGCGTNGFPATSGWDPVTGVGTPMFNELLNILGV